MDKTVDKVAVLMGGFSAERDVSLKSGAAVAKGLRDAGYQIVDVDVRDADWVMPDGVTHAFIALHGTYGEDGGVQTRLEDLGVTYTGAGPESSRIAFDKLLSKARFIEAGVSTPEFAVIREGDACPFELPVVVKPPCQGSSIGLYIVESDEDWARCNSEVWQYGDEQLVETFVSGRELTVGLVGDQVLPVIEIIPESGRYDYESKYTSGRTEYQVPARLSESQTLECQELAKKAYDVLDCRGMGRVDVLLGDDSRFYVLEVNTLPGFTATSLLPKAAAAAGMNFSELCDRILRISILK